MSYLNPPVINFLMRKTRVLGFGTFDVLHPGHLSYLRQAKALGTELIVIIARGVNVRRFKHKSTVFSGKQRQTLVGALKMVDQAALGFKDDIYKSVMRFKPDVVAMGYDQKPSTAEVRRELAKRGLCPKIVRCKPFNPCRHKSTKIKKRIRLGT